MSEHSQVEAAEVAQDVGSTASPESEVQGAPGDTESEPRVFTQEELDAKVGERLAKERRKWHREQVQAAEQQRVSATQPPQPNQFPNAEAYLDALSDHKADLKIAQREQAKQRTQADSTYHEREEEARTKYTDFEQVAYSLPKDGGPAISNEMAEVIKASDLGPEIAYHLGQNVSESFRIYNLSPLQQAREIGKIEANLMANPSTKNASSAPNPIKPVGSRSSSPAADTSDPRSDSMSTRDWIEKENKRRMKLQG